MHFFRLVILLGGFLAAAYTTAEGILHIGNAGEPETLDPHKYNLRLEETLLNDLFMGLTTFDAAGNLVPGAAQAWSTSEDGLSWTFELRQGMQWSDGKSLDAADFVFAFRRLQDPTTAASLAYFMYMIKNAEAVNTGREPLDALGVYAPDPHTLVLELNRPYPYLLERLLYPTAFPVPAHAIKQHGAAWIKPQNWVSNGAYVLNNWHPQAHISLRQNPYFYAQTEIAEVRYHPVVNEQSAYNRFRNHELHAIAGFPAGELETVQTTHPDALRLSSLLSMMYLVFNTQRPPFNDVRVRQALSLAVDQRVLTDKVLRSGSAPAYSFAPALIQNYSPALLPHQATPLAARLGQARALMTAAGYSRDAPLEITLRHLNSLENKKLNLAIAGMWRQIGVRTKLQQGDVRNHFSDLRQGDFEVAWAGWVGENNAEHYLTLLQSDIGNVNYGRFNNLEYDDLLKAAQNQAAVSARNQILSQAEALVVHHYPVVPLYTNAVRRLVSPQLTGWHENLRDVHQIRYLGWR